MAYKFPPASSPGSPIFSTLPLFSPPAFQRATLKGPGDEAIPYVKNLMRWSRIPYMRTTVQRTRSALPVNMSRDRLLRNVNKKCATPLLWIQHVHIEIGTWSGILNRSISFSPQWTFGTLWRMLPLQRYVSRGAMNGPAPAPLPTAHLA